MKFWSKKARLDLLDCLGPSPSGWHEASSHGLSGISNAKLSSLLNIPTPCSQGEMSPTFSSTFISLGPLILPLFTMASQHAVLMLRCMVPAVIIARIKVQGYWTSTT